ncbi:MAG: hypothetical protein AAF546_12395 [Verrucomicrobiota bacterium]
MNTLSDYESLYQELAKELQKEKWFSNSWQTQAGFYPNAQQPKSVFIQLFRDTWFNEEGKGIHFESWMTNADVKRGTTSVVIHIESSKARTGINGKTLVKNLLGDVGSKISDWEGYKLKETYTMQPFMKKMEISPENIVGNLQIEFNRLEGIADAVDSAIIEAMK